MKIPTYWFSLESFLLTTNCRPTVGQHPPRFPSRTVGGRHAGGTSTAPAKNERLFRKTAPYHTVAKQCRPLQGTPQDQRHQTKRSLPGEVRWAFAHRDRHGRRHATAAPDAILVLTPTHGGGAPLLSDPLTFSLNVSPLLLPPPSSPFAMDSSAAHARCACHNPKYLPPGSAISCRALIVAVVAVAIATQPPHRQRIHKQE